MQTHALDGDSGAAQSPAPKVSAIGDCLSMQTVKCWFPILLMLICQSPSRINNWHNVLTINHWSSQCWLLIHYPHDQHKNCFCKIITHSGTMPNVKFFNRYICFVLLTDTCCYKKSIFSWVPCLNIFARKFKTPVPLNFMSPLLPVSGYWRNNNTHFWKFISTTQDKMFKC